MAKHAILSASGAEKWSNCAAAPRMEMLAPKEDNSFYSAQGTAAHFLASETLNEGHFRVGEADIGSVIHVFENGDCTKCNGSGKWDSEFQFTVDDAMVEHVNTYLAAIKDFKGDDGTLFVEQKASIEVITKEEGAEGTADTVIIRGTELQIHDLKYGMTFVDATLNKQLIMYAKAVYEEYSLLFDIDKILLVIHQPRLGSMPTFSMTVDELNYEVDALYLAAKIATSLLEAESVTDVEPYLVVGEHCRKNYCKARTFCPAYRAEMNKVRLVDLTSIESLVEAAQHLESAEDCCKQIRARIITEVLNGNEVPGYKAVMGKEGNRKWEDEKVAEEMLASSMKLKHEIIYDKSLKSPTSIEKAAKKGEVGPKQWKRIQEIIVRDEAKVTVVPESDKRPAVKIEGNDPLDDFDLVE